MCNLFKNILWPIYAMLWNYLAEVTPWFICSTWLLPFSWLYEYIVSIQLALCLYLYSVPREVTYMKLSPWEKSSKDPWDKWITQSKGKKLFSGIQHSHGGTAHKKWSISTASRSQFPIQRITQERGSELVSASGTAAESTAGRNTIYKSEEATVNTKFFLLSLQVTKQESTHLPNWHHMKWEEIVIMTY